MSHNDHLIRIWKAIVDGNEHVLSFMVNEMRRENTVLTEEQCREALLRRAKRMLAS